MAPAGAGPGAGLCGVRAALAMDGGARWRRLLGTLDAGTPGPAAAGARADRLLLRLHLGHLHHRQPLPGAARQRRAFTLGLLPTDEGARILPEDARPLQRKLDAVTSRKPYILANMIRQAMNKYAISRSSADASEAVRTAAEVDLGRLVTSMATVHYLAWAIPALGFLGTVRGLSGALSMASQIDNDSLQSFISQATRHLNVAFDCTLVALVLSLAIMFLLHSVQRDEEALVIDCQQYCQEHLVNRLYVPEPAYDAV